MSDETAWDYNPNALLKLHRVGQGRFGEVFMGMIQEKVVAFKYLKGDFGSFIREAVTVRNLNHDNLIKIIGICSIKQCIIMEYMQNQNLKFYMSNSPTLTPSQRLSERLTISQKIANGMIYLVQRRIIHRDLAAKNILIGKTIDIVKIADLGLSKQLDPEKDYCEVENGIFPLEWTAPEGFHLGETILPKQIGKVTHASDVWSFGIVLWEIYSNGADPYDTSMLSRDKLHKMLTEQNYRLGSPIDCPEVIYETMKECWNLEPSARPSFESIHAFLSSEETALTQPSFAPSVEQDSNNSTSFRLSDMPSQEQSGANALDGDQWLSLSPREPEIRPNNGNQNQLLQNEVLDVVEDTLNDAINRQIREQIKRSILNASRAAEVSGQACLKAFDGLYVRAKGTTEEGVWIVDEVEHRLECEEWIIKESDGRVVLENHYHNNWFLRAYHDGSVGMSYDQEKWTPVKNGNGTWSFETQFGQFLSACRRDLILSTMPHNRRCEQFHIEWWQ